MFLLLISSFLAIQPTQQYYKSYIEPFYRDSMASNTNYTYNLTVNPPDGIGSVASAIINFNGQINGQTQTFTLWVNGQSCNNPTYSVATAFSTTGNVQFAFDCSNRIKKSGIYNITLRSAVNTGAMQGWLDLTYTNSPLGEMIVHGTEYEVNEPAKVWLQLLDTNKQPINNGSCYVDIYTPSSGVFREKQSMVLIEEGVYSYDFTTPSVLGVYPAIAICYYDSNTTTVTANTGTINFGINVTNGVVSTRTSDDVRWVIQENSTYWWDARFNSRINITINNTVSSTLSNYPVLINITKNPQMQSDYDDLRFINGICGTGATSQLAYEIDNYTATNALIWVKIPSLTTGINNICLYYGNSTITSGENKTGVWDDNYVAVYHLGETGNGTTGEYKDSTKYGNNGTGGSGIIGGSSTPTRITGIVAGGQNFTSSQTDFISIAHSPTIGLTIPITLEAWTSTTTTAAGYPTIIGRQYGTVSTDSYSLLANNPSSSLGIYMTGGGRFGGAISVNRIYYVAGTDSPTAATVYYDGVSSATGGSLSISTDTNPTLIGANENLPTTTPSNLWDGMIDEVRISNIVRSADWISYTNQIIRDNPTIVKFGSEANKSSAPANQASINVSFIFNNINTTFLYNSITTSWEGQWNGLGDNLLIQVYNFSSATWLNYTNVISYKIVDEVVTNTIFFPTASNISSKGYVNNSGSMIIRIIDTNTTEIDANVLSTDYIGILAVYQSGGTWEEIRGSSEVHITNRTQQLAAQLSLVSSNISAGFSGVNSQIDNLSIQNGQQYGAVISGLSEIQYNISYYSNLTPELVWNYTNRNLTYPTLNEVAAAVWNYTPTRNLTYYQDVTNYTRIDNTIYAVNVSLYNKIISEIDLVLELVNSLHNQTLVNISLIPMNVWNYTERYLTYERDTTNYTKGALYVWNYSERNLTSPPLEGGLEYMDIIS